MSEEDLINLTQGERLLYLIKKYYSNQSVFAEAVGLSSQSINGYCNNNLTIPRKSLSLFEEKVGFNRYFLLTGKGNEFVDGWTEAPPPVSDNIVIVTKKPLSDTTDKAKLKRGDCSQFALNSSRRFMVLTDAGIVNVVDVAFNGLKNPALLQIIDSEFCNKYNFKPGIAIVIDKGNYEDGELVFVRYKRQYFIADYYEGELKDVKGDDYIPIGKDTEIIGAVYKKIEGF